jgi:hypothetical protein
LEAKPALGVRHLRENRHSSFVQFTAQENTTSATCADELSSAADATGCMKRTVEVSVVFTDARTAYGQAAAEWAASARHSIIVHDEFIVPQLRQSAKTKKDDEFFATSFCAHRSSHFVEYRARKI